MVARAVITVGLSIASIPAASETTQGCLAPMFSNASVARPGFGGWRFATTPPLMKVVALVDPQLPRTIFPCEREMASQVKRQGAPGLFPAPILQGQAQHADCHHGGHAKHIAFCGS